MRSDEMVENAWTRARATCECDCPAHSHADRCGTALVWEQRGKSGPGGWEAVNTGHKSVGDWQAVQACRIFCWGCYQKATTDAARRHIPAQPGAADAHDSDRR